MKISCRITGMDGIKAAFARVKDGLSSPQILEKVADGFKERILERAALNRDVDNAPFASYAPGYAKKLARLGNDPGRVTLRRRGAMLDSITSSSTPAQFVLSFDSSNEAMKARRIQQTGLGSKRVKRRFFALSADDRAWAARTMDERVKEKIREALK